MHTLIRNVNVNERSGPVRRSGNAGGGRGPRGRGGTGPHGRAVQVYPIKSMLKAPGTERLNLKYASA